ncbi:MAG: polysaccharide biosynthesis C-terminal domain-containing protein [Bacteroidales bacterium]|nr:polysaccharide biosynthesis C-terminal domain-containing protein [Bacteroidales bacterium]
MFAHNFLKTIFSKFFILFVNFGIIIFTTNFWGSEGKGLISLFIADLTIVSFFSSIIIGSSLSYFTPREDIGKILTLSYIWTILISMIVPFVVILIHFQDYLIYLFLVSFFFSLHTINTNVFVGKENITAYNLYQVLQVVLFVLILLLFIYVLKINSIETYFIAQILSYAILFITSSFKIFKTNEIVFKYCSKTFSKLFIYGWKSQLSSFMQFLNYRLSYYFLLSATGLSGLGIYSVGVAFSEAIWTISRSISVTLYSRIINISEKSESIRNTKIALKLCFNLTILFIIVIIILPSEFYTFIFGKDFSDVKQTVILLSPGILSIASSNIIGHYFSGINQFTILNIKSFIGLIFTIIGSVILIPAYGIVGACISTSISYFISSIILFIYFYRKTQFSISDFFIIKSDIPSIKKSLFNK